MSMLRFVEQGHKYYVGDRELPSVTTVMDGLLTDFSKIPTKVFEHKRQVGKAAHVAAMLDDLDALDLASVHADVAPFLGAWQKFKGESLFVNESIEEALAHERYGYAGTPDRVGHFQAFPDIREIVDIKCRMIPPPEAGPQLAAYQKMYELKHRCTIHRRRLVLLFPNGDYRAPLIKTNLDQDFSTFISCLNIYNYRREHGLNTDPTF